ncbi:hypothetical protein BOX15_Mlig015506g1 [Macrostomum lignano]|uniref:Uncharacterized protein n=1 Tax=Macrostomum lignano TaxID=282301 RepID=A0A267DUZ6_9PLAT|nr:hypothetical protein BOX15_Mlig015506g1 [Macrostomum lignano]
MATQWQQLLGLLASVSDCRTLLSSSLKSSSQKDGKCCNCWLTEPACALVRARKLSRLTDMQLEALTAIQSFCLLCRRHRSHNASNAAAAVMTSTWTERDRRCLHGKNHRPPHQRLGMFRSAIIRQLWEIHRLLLALIDMDKAREDRSAKPDCARKSSRCRSLSAIEMQLDTTSSEVRCCGDSRRIGFGEQRFLSIPLHQECHNMQTPSGSPTTIFETRPHQKLNATSMRSNSMSEWSFACAAAADRQVCFASTVCVGKVGSAPKALAAKSAVESAKPATQAPFKANTAAKASGNEQPLIDVDLILLKKNYQQFVEQNVNSMSSPYSRSDSSATIDSDVPELSSNSDKKNKASKIREDIVFQRVLCTEDRSQARKVGSSNAVLLTTLSSLKSRIDAIKKNLSERDCDGCSSFSADHNGGESASRRKSRSDRSDRGRRPTSQPVPAKPEATRGPARNQSNLNLKLEAQPTQWQLRSITARLDRTVSQLGSMLGSAMWLCRRRSPGAPTLRRRSRRK